MDHLGGSMWVVLYIRVSFRVLFTGAVLLWGTFEKGIPIK